MPKRGRGNPNWYKGMEVEPERQAKIRQAQDHKELRRARQKVFLKAFEDLGVMSAAAKQVGIYPNTIHIWRRRDPVFRQRYNRVLELHIEKLEQECDRRAVEGVDRPVFQNGTLVGHIKDYSDVLLIFRLKALAPHKYRDNPPPRAPQDGETLVFQVVHQAPLQIPATKQIEMNPVVQKLTKRLEQIQQEPAVEDAVSFEVETNAPGGIEAGADSEPANPSGS